MKHKLKLYIILSMIGIMSTQLHAQTTSWQWLNPLPQGNTLSAVHFIDANTGTAVGSNGTILHTTNGGTTWIFQSSGTTSYLFGVSFIDANTGTAVGTGGTIVHTTDGGSTWTSQSSETTNDLRGVSFADASNGTAVGEGGRILHTSNGGTTWTHQSSGTTYYLFGVSFPDADTGFAVGDIGTILRTTDGGSTWTNQSQPINGYLTGVSFIDGITGTAVGRGFDNDSGYYAAILHTTDGGFSWTPQSGGTMQTLFSVVISDANTGTAVGDAGTILHTTDGGSTWVSQQGGTTSNLMGVSVIAPGTENAVGVAGTMLRTTDGGSLWTSQSSGITDHLLDVSFTDAHTGAAVGFDYDPVAGSRHGRIYRTTNGGVTWTIQLSDTALFLNGITFADANTGIAVGYSYDSMYHGTILRSTDGGNTWATQPLGITGGLSSVYFSDANTGFAVGGSILRTTDGGISWSIQSSGISDPLNGVFFTDAKTGTAVGGYVSPPVFHGVIIHTTDGGVNWFTQFNDTLGAALNSVFFTDANTGTAVGDAGIVLQTTNGGTSWSSRPSGISSNLRKVSFTDANTGIAVGDEGNITQSERIFVTTNGGADWSGMKSPTSNPLNSVSTARSGAGWIAVAVGEQGTIICAAISPLNGKTWTGIVDSSWNRDSNWTPLGVPSPGDSVVIPPAGTSPVIFQTQQQITVAALTIPSGGRLTITEALARFVVKGDVTVQGTFELRPPAPTDIVVGGNWNIKTAALSKSGTSAIDEGFLPASSTVRLQGNGIFSRNFFNLVLDTSSAMISNGNVFVENQCATLKGVTLRSNDTLFIRSGEPQSIVGAGIIHHGTIKRALLQNSLQRYRFESDSTYVRFHSAAAYPATVAMTAYPDSNLSLNGVIWTIVPGALDTIANTVSADSVTHFSKWAVGVVRPGSGIESPVAGDTVILRFYDLDAGVDSGFLAQLSLRYDQSELPAGSTENSIRLFRSEIVVGVQEENPRLPASFALEQNYPNPFNPITVIRYQLPVVERSGTSLYDVSLIVYNVLGQQVAELVNETQSAGYKSATFDAGTLASGVYFYKIEATGVSDLRRSFSDFKKMIVLR